MIVGGSFLLYVFIARRWSQIQENIFGPELASSGLRNRNRRKERKMENHYRLNNGVEIPVLGFGTGKQ